MGMAEKIFKADSLGHSTLQLKVVALIFLEEDAPFMDESRHADRLLSSFCHWQATLEGLKHDHALFLTGRDICSYKNSPCDTLGKPRFLDPAPG